MKKIQEPKLKVIKFENRDVIATSTETFEAKRISLQGTTNYYSSWHNLGE